MTTIAQAPRELTDTDPVAVNAMRLLISCPDQPGIVAAVAGLLHHTGANIIRSDQFSTDPYGGGTFFLRMEFTVPPERKQAFTEQFGLRVAEPFGMTWRLWDPATPKRVTVLVSRYDHCLHDLLWRWRRHELGAEVVQVISNWEDFREDVEGAGLPYHHVPVPKGGKPEAEAQMLELLSDTSDVVVLARYMQILSGEFLDRLGLPVINIHHSFLPAFEGAGPYERAKERGVKLVGATAHYVTADLDAGPIIEQDVVRVTHAHSAADLARMGAEIERAVLARAVRWHCEDRVIRHGNSTVVF
jgi:formyltetrahydrofolate deformylase